MRESIDIQGVGEVFLAKPRSFAAISDRDWETSAVSSTF